MSAKCLICDQSFVAGEVKFCTSDGRTLHLKCRNAWFPSPFVAMLSTQKFPSILDIVQEHEDVSLQSKVSSLLPIKHSIFRRITHQPHQFHQLADDLIKSDDFSVSFSSAWLKNIKIGLHSLLISLDEIVGSTLQQVSKGPTSPASIFVVGRTGIGKSTLLAYILGYKLIKYQKSLRYVDEPEIPHPVIGHGGSETKGCLVYPYRDGSALEFVDCAGTMDNMGLDHDICNSISLSIAAKARHPKKILIVVKSEDIVSERGSEFMEIVRRFARTFRCENIEDAWRGVIFVVNDQRKLFTEEGEVLECEAVREYLTESLSELIRQEEVQIGKKIAKLNPTLMSHFKSQGSSASDEKMYDYLRSCFSSVTSSVGFDSSLSPSIETHFQAVPEEDRETIENRERVLNLLKYTVQHPENFICVSLSDGGIGHARLMAALLENTSSLPPDGLALECLYEDTVPRIKYNLEKFVADLLHHFFNRIQSFEQTLKSVENMVRLRVAALHDLETISKEIQSQVLEGSTQFQRLEERKTQLNESIESLENQISKLSVSIDASAADVARLQAQCDQCDSEIAPLDIQIREVTATILSFAQSHSNDEAAERQLYQDLQELDAQISGKELKLQAIGQSDDFSPEAAGRVTEAQFKDIRWRIASLETEMGSWAASEGRGLEDRRMSLELVVKEKIKENDEQLAGLSASRRRESCEAMSKSTAELREQIGGMEESIGHFHRQIAAYQTSLSDQLFDQAVPMKKVQLRSQVLGFFDSLASKYQFAFQTPFFPGTNTRIPISNVAEICPPGAKFLDRSLERVSGRYSSKFLPTHHSNPADLGCRVDVYVHKKDHPETAIMLAELRKSLSSASLKLQSLKAQLDRRVKECEAQVEKSINEKTAAMMQKSQTLEERMSQLKDIGLNLSIASEERSRIEREFATHREFALEKEQEVRATIETLMRRKTELNAELTSRKESTLAQGHRERSDAEHQKHELESVKADIASLITQGIARKAGLVYQLSDVKGTLNSQIRERQNAEATLQGARDERELCGQQMETENTLIQQRLEADITVDLEKSKLDAIQAEYLDLVKSATEQLQGFHLARDTCKIIADFIFAQGLDKKVSDEDEMHRQSTFISFFQRLHCPDRLCCEHDHPMWAWDKVVGMKALSTSMSSWSCSNCDKPGEGFRWVCLQCDVDVCFACDAPLP